MNEEEKPMPEPEEKERIQPINALNPFLGQREEEYQEMLESSLVRGLNKEISIKDDDEDCGEIRLGLEVES